MLVAPAGYGKTTLARQWLADRPHVWCEANPGSADVAALALAVSEALDPLAPGARQLLLERIGATSDIEQEVSVLAEIQTEVLREWPSNAWLAVDDYQLLRKSEVAESYIHRLLTDSPLRLLLTSRERPAWATARKLLYGEIYEIGRSPLAMSQDEAQSVFRASSTDGLAGLVALAEGWPAVIGLASLTQADHLDGVVPETLYEYFADELYQAAGPTLQRALPELALSPHLTLEMATSLFGPRRGRRLLEEACNLGFMTMTATRAELHPLLRTFLLHKLEDLPHAREEAVRKIAEFHLERKAWDDAFALLRQCPLPDVLLVLVDSALSVYVADWPCQHIGRVAEVGRRTQSPFTGPRACACRTGHTYGACARCRNPSSWRYEGQRSRRGTQFARILLGGPCRPPRQSRSRCTCALSRGTKPCGRGSRTTGRYVGFLPLRPSPSL